MREKIMPPLVLTLICVIISGLLVLANAATKDKIAQTQQDKLNTSLEALFGEGQYTPLEDLHYDGVTQVIRSAKNEVIFEITVDGYSTDGLQLLIGIDPEGKLAGISFVSIGETPGLGTKVQDVIDFCGGFKVDPGKVIFGGPMMGMSMPDTSSIVVKSTNAILCFDKKDAVLPEPTACIKCGRCISHCPLKLMPADIETAYELNKPEDLKALQAKIQEICDHTPLTFE